MLRVYVRCSISSFLPRAASFSTCDMCLRFRSCLVVLDIELSVSAWYQKTRRVLLRARRLLLLLLVVAESGGVRCAASLSKIIRWSGNKVTILCQSEHQKIPPNPQHPRLENHVFSSRNPAATIKHQRCYVSHAYCAAHITATPLPAGIEGIRTHASVYLMRTSAGVLCLANIGDWRSRSFKIYAAKDEEVRTGLGCELLY